MYLEGPVFAICYPTLTPCHMPVEPISTSARDTDSLSGDDLETHTIVSTGPAMSFDIFWPNPAMM